ncbi:transposable element Tcb2 transposase [Trichonephila clavipes]|uniref:Transposable element Tcb2 transposase n=1 Tax=Trichonephila clavipes TaxID=2585209 RepID=A0A8X6WCH0_TRICX|nr:transposable element Tcb2 transposase [Trichonephila clavipes]
MKAGWSAGRVDRQNQVVFSEEYRFNLSSDDNQVRAWRALGKHLNPASAIQRHTAPTSAVIVWGAITYDAQSLLILIHDTITAQWYVHDIIQPHLLPLMAGLPGAIFQQGCHKTASATLPSHFPRLVDP